MTRSRAARKFVAVVSAGFIATALVQPFPALADGITLNRNCEDPTDSACAVEIAPSTASASTTATTGPSTGIGPAIELNLAVNQVADAGTAVHLTRTGTGSGNAASGQPAGAAINGFAVSLGQSGTATATSGNASAGGTVAQAGGSTVVQNPPSSESDSADTGSGDPGAQTPPSGGSTSGVNMITTVASVVQVVQVVAKNNKNTTIAPIQLAEQCQQTAVSCQGSSAGTGTGSSAPATQ